MTQKLTTLILLCLALAACRQDTSGDDLNALIEWEQAEISDTYSPEGYFLDPDEGDMYETTLELLTPKIKGRAPQGLKEGLEDFMRTRYGWIYSAVPGSDALPLDQVIAQYAAQRYEEYSKSIKEVEGGEFHYALSSQESARDSVVYSADGLISMLLYSDTYSGGAHGMYGHYGATYDLERQQTITPEVLFRPGCEAELLDLIQTGIIARDVLDPDALGGWASYSEMVDFDALFVPANLYLTADGVTLIYNVYEIGPYAIGEVTLDLTYDQLRPYLRAPYDRLARD